jgi:hypothetical protein
MTDELFSTSPGRWLRFKSACKYLDIAPSTMSLKLNSGTGPRHRTAPGSRHKIFWSGDLDDWILSAAPHPVTEAERERLAKLQAGAERVREERRSRRQAKTEEDVTA